MHSSTMEIKIQNDNFQDVILCVPCIFLISKICSMISWYSFSVLNKNDQLLEILTLILACAITDQEYYLPIKMAKTPQDPLPPLWPVFQALSGEQIAQKAPLGQKRHSGLGKKRNRSIEHLQITYFVFSIDLFSNSLCI